LAEHNILLRYDDGLNELEWVDRPRRGQRGRAGRLPQRPMPGPQPPIAGQPPQHDHGVGLMPEPAVPTPTPNTSMAMTAMRMAAMPGMPDPIDICLAAKEGFWELLACDSRVLAVHAVLMYTGRVLFFAGSGNNVPRHNAHDVRSVVWDYQAGTFHTPVTPFDVFCAGQTVLSDGKVLVAGGTQQYDPFVGQHSAWFF